MKHQDGQPCRNCIVGSLAILLDEPTQIVEKNLGIDYMQLVWPSLPEPLCYRGVHLEEVQYFLMAYNMALVPYYESLDYLPQGASVPYSVQLGLHWRTALEKYDGLLVGQYAKSTGPHAVAWSCEDRKIYDPAGFTADYSSFRPECFMALVRSTGTRAGTGPAMGTH